MSHAAIPGGTRAVPRARRAQPANPPPLSHPQVDEFPMNFKIQGPKPAARNNPDKHLPHSQTCFFTLSLPFYSSQEICYQKLIYAMENATTMDDDFTNRDQWGAQGGS